MGVGLLSRGISVKYIQVVKDIYDKATTTMRIAGGDSHSFLILIGLHQGSALSPYLLTLVMNELTIYKEKCRHV